MTTLATAILDDSRAFLRDYLRKIERSFDLLTEDDVWWRPNPVSNSIGNLMLHLEGSTRMWVAGVAGQQQVERDRDAEFAARDPLPKAVLLARLRAAQLQADSMLASFDEKTLLARRTRGEDEFTGLWAVYHAVEHFAMHTGQILTLTKLRTGVDLKPRS